MTRISRQEFTQRLEGGKPVTSILLLGDEPFLRDACRAQLIDKYVPEAARAWAVSRFSAERGQTQSALDQAQTLPMLSPQQLVFLEEAEAIEQLGDKKRDETVKSILDYTADPAPFTILVIEASRLDMRMTLGKKLAEATLVVDVGLGDRIEDRIAAAIGLATALAKERGFEFEKGAAEDLAESVTGDLMRLKTEIEKLATFAATRKSIRREDVSGLVISEKTTTIWEVAGFLASQQPKRALEFLDRLLREGEEPIKMLGAITWMYRKIIEATEVRTTNGYQAARALGMRPDQAELALRCARRISKRRLMQGLRALREADSRLKDGNDERIVMEFLLYNLSRSL